MCDKNFIFISPARKQFFRSSVGDKVEGFRKLKDYRLACGDIDAQSFDNDRQDLNDEGWYEIPSPQFVRVKLYYVKPSGKYYSEGTIEVNLGEATADPAKSWMETMDKIRYLLDSGNLPGLIKGSKFDVFVTGQGHPGGYPHLFRIN
ncbi:hypothetical protein F416_gp119 [Salmonella typhimurium phage PhiSH19]|uniref:Uncharacterized protein n=3 Tax=Kuttervirus TaxID=2169536 RepID=G8GDP5_9CAUD|nr:hypothetical protein F416_gp119 [Salmonella phage Sh19]AER70251.1 hypothetical protein [Salmonella phage Sh19]CAB5494573.1 hypothetical protein [Salmonella phage Se_AO1]